MKTSNICPKCGSNDINADLKCAADGQFLIYKQLSPEALIFKETVYGTVSAWVCGGCGFTEFYADAPGALKGKRE